MRRRDTDGNVSDLPQLDLAALDVDERLAWPRRDGNMFHGCFAVVHVGRVLGADVPDTGTNVFAALGPPVVEADLRTAVRLAAREANH